MESNRRIVAVCFGLNVLVALIWYQSMRYPYLHAASQLKAERAAGKAEGQPLTPDDLRPNTSILDSKNAALVYRQISYPSGLDSEFDVLRAALNGTPADRRRVRSLISKYAGQIRLAERAANMPACDFNRDWALGMALLFTESAPMRQTARLLAARAILLCDAGRPIEALESVRVGARMAGLIDRNPPLITYLVRLVIEAIMDRPLRRIICRYWNRADVIAAGRRVNAAFGEDPDPVPEVRGQVLLCVLIAKEVRSSSEPFSPELKERLLGLSPEILADCAEAHSLSYWRRLFTAIAAAGSNRMAQFRAIEAVVQQEESLSVTHSGTVKPSYELSAIVEPYFTRCWTHTVEALAERRLRATMFDLIDYRRSHGQFPSSLSELPHSPALDPFINAPFHYKPSENKFKLYSVGENLKDDGGIGTSQRTGEPPRDFVLSFPN